ncbi:hypothetical protein ACQY0O_003735 [Thecaphora frezii]
MQGLLIGSGIRDSVGCGESGVQVWGSGLGFRFGGGKHQLHRGCAHPCYQLPPPIPPTPLPASVPPPPPQPPETSSNQQQPTPAPVPLPPPPCPCSAPMTPPPASPPPLFRKRASRTTTGKAGRITLSPPRFSTSDGAGTSTNPTDAASSDGDDVAETALTELMTLRHLAKRPEGIALDKLNHGDAEASRRRRKKKEGPLTKEEKWEEQMRKGGLMAREDEE